MIGMDNSNEEQRNKVKIVEQKKTRHEYNLYRILCGFNHIVVGRTPAFKTVFRIIAWSFALCGVLLFIILMANSFIRIEHNEVGLIYDTFTNHLDSELIQEGRTYTLPDNKAIKYKTSAQKINLNKIACISKDGIRIVFTAEVRFIVVENKVYDITLDFKDEKGLLNYIKKVTRAAIRDTCGIFQSEDFYIRREAVDAELELIIDDMYEFSGGYVTRFSSQLKNIALPKELQDAIESKQNKEQQILRAVEERKGAFTDANNKLSYAYIEGRELIIRAEADAQVTVDVALVNSEAILERWAQRGIEIESYFEEYGGTPEDLVRHLERTIMANSPDTVYVISG